MQANQSHQKIEYILYKKQHTSICSFYAVKTIKTRRHYMDDHVLLTASHRVYLAETVMILIFIVFRREVFVQSLIVIFLLGILAAQRHGVVDRFIIVLQYEF